MMKLIIAGKDGLKSPIIFMGINRQNVSELKKGNPIVFPGSDIGVPEFDLVSIAYGQSNEEITKQLEKHGLVKDDSSDKVIKCFTIDPATLARMMLGGSFSMTREKYDFTPLEQVVMLYVENMSSFESALRKSGIQIDHSLIDIRIARARGKEL